jgi:hypothetical protein
MSNAIDANALKTLVAGVDSTSSADGSPAPTGGTTNTIEITIQRAVAKAKVTYHNSATLSTKDGSGQLRDVKYLFLNVNRAVYPFQYLGLGVTPTPGGPGALSNYPQSPYYEDTYTKDGNVSNWKDYYYNYPLSDTIEMKTSADAATVPAYYVTENTQQLNHVLGNTTAVGVKATFMPAAGKCIMGLYEGPTAGDTIKFAGVTFTVPAGKRNTDCLSVGPTDTLYQVRGGRGVVLGISDSMFFTNKLTAYKVAYIINCITQAGFSTYVNNFDPANWTKLPADFPASVASSLRYDIVSNHNPSAALVAEFAGGKCYYSVRFADRNAKPETGVKRNHYYEFNITEFKGIGKESLEDVNKPPTNSVEEGDTYVTATLKIEQWRSVKSDVVPDEY